MLYNIDVHIFFPPTMYTPGYDAEGLTKPKITKEIEGPDDGMTADQAANVLFKECIPPRIAAAAAVLYLFI
ncbi:hypothetical protein H0H93_011492 [Arthromyces matolae]|nr:hypothetical protein H0H93_011492 [Arthromyces matolae]